MRSLRGKLGSDARGCRQVHELMSDYMDGELEPGAARRVDDHVGVCPRCRRVLANLRLTLERLHLLGDKAPPGTENQPEATERIRATWRQRI